ncbi:MAG TPA: DUF6069 family protein [Pseudonocardiaceae bacterium]|nr:DUF6069 family protein [Pseudonocardiaceae bacterium]
MTVNPAQRGTPRQLDAGKLWAGGGATAVVAALAALVGILIARGLAHVAILAPKGAGAWGSASSTVYVILSAVVALIATGLLHFLLTTTPRATQFFGWIMGLLIVVAMVIPLSLVTDTDDKVATALLNLLIGLAIAVPLTNVAHIVRGREVLVVEEDPMVDPRVDPRAPRAAQQPLPPTRQERWNG